MLMHADQELTNERDVPCVEYADNTRTLQAHFLQHEIVPKSCAPLSLRFGSETPASERSFAR